MSDKSQSLPICDEPTFASTSEKEASWRKGEKVISQDELRKSAEASNGHSFDDTVFIALSGKNISENVDAVKKVVEEQIIQADELPGIQQIVRTALDNVNTAQYFPASIMPAASTTNGGKVFLEAPAVAKDDHVILWEEKELLPKKLKLSEKTSIIKDDHEKDLFLSIVDTDALTITCKKNRAVMYTNKLGSGNKGKCIKFGNEWYTPSKFENICGLAMSKDWKRSIRYGGRTMQYLINKGYIRPHAATCTCAVCSDDETVVGPVRYFTPKARRKRSATSSVSLASLGWEGESNASMRPMTAPLVQGPAFSHDFIPLTVSAFSPMPRNKVDASKDKQPNFLNVVSSSDMPSPTDGEALIQAISENDTSERKLWSQLEEKANNMMDKVMKLQETIAQAKADCISKRNKLFKQVLTHLEKQKNEQELPTAFKFDSSLTSPLQLKKQLIHNPDDDNGNKEDEDTEICRACGRQAISECTGCHKATYCSTTCQEKDWRAGHRNTCRGLANQPSLSTDVPAGIPEPDNA